MKVNVLHNGYWTKCLSLLKQNLTDQEQGVWIAPLQVDESNSLLEIYCPNQYVKGFFEQKCLPLLENLQRVLSFECVVKVGHKKDLSKKEVIPSENTIVKENVVVVDDPSHIDAWSSKLNPAYVFDQYVLGSSNQMAYSASKLVVSQPGSTYNPLVLYGDVGLGKTHLMQAIGHALSDKYKVYYVHSERFVSMMVRALQTQNMQKFKDSFRSVSLLLLDDIQFFANKERSQEELFHVMNALLDCGVQLVVTCDRFPKELEGMADRLKSRFACGLTVGIDPPDLETRVAILISKAKLSGIDLSEQVAFFIAERINGNVRELEGALKRLIANAFFTKEEITIPFVKLALRDLIQMHSRLQSIDSIQKLVAKHYKLKITEFLGLSRKKSLVLPRQLAMYLVKELTDHSLPEIGLAFGGRDHTTVLHAVRKIRTLLDEKHEEVSRDLELLMRSLS